MTEEKKVKVDPITKEVEVPIDLTEEEYNKLNERLVLFNEGLDSTDKLTIGEFISLVFKTNLLEEELILKKKFYNFLATDIIKLENELETKYSIGLEGSSEVFNKVIEQRIKTLKEPITINKDFREDYILLLANGIEAFSYGMDSDELLITLKETYLTDIKENPSEVLEAISIVKKELDTNTYNYEEIIKVLTVFEKYVGLI